MPVFPKSVEWPPAGTLQGEGRSKVWEGRIAIAPFGEFDLRVHGTAEGPTPAQTGAMQKVLANAAALRDAAGAPMVEVIAEGGILPDGLVLDTASLWSHLKPSFVEVAQPGYDPGGAIAISLGFEMPWWVEHLLHIRTLDGEFDEACPE
jgi:hypothetical protein